MRMWAFTLGVDTIPTQKGEENFHIKNNLKHF